jgi:hypothetical protein
MDVAIVCDAEGLAGRVDGDVEGVFEMSTPRFAPG